MGMVFGYGPASSMVTSKISAFPIFPEHGTVCGWTYKTVRDPLTWYDWFCMMITLFIPLLSILGYWLLSLFLCTFNQQHCSFFCFLAYFLVFVCIHSSCCFLASSVSSDRNATNRHLWLWWIVVGNSWHCASERHSESWFRRIVGNLVLVSKELSPIINYCW
jgi:hypothetical protein